MESSLPTPTPADFACLLDSQALGESILKRHLADLNSRPEPPSTDATTYAILSLRRTTENRRKIMLMINPDAFRRTPRTNPDDPSPHETPRAWRHSKTFYPDPRDPYQDNVAPAPSPVHPNNSDSNFHSSNFSLHSSPPPIAVHANPYLLNPNADDDYDPNDDFDDPELDADLTSDPSDPCDPIDPVILSKISSSAPSANSVALCENSSYPVDSPDPEILSKISSSSVSAPLRDISSSEFSNSPFAIRNSSDPGILSKSSSSTISAPSREKTSSKSPPRKFTLQDFLARTRADAVDKSLGNGLDPPITS